MIHFRLKIKSMISRRSKWKFRLEKMINCFDTSEKNYTEWEILMRVIHFAPGTDKKWFDQYLPSRSWDFRVQHGKGLSCYRKKRGKMKRLKKSARMFCNQNVWLISSIRLFSKGKNASELCHKMINILIIAKAFSIRFLSTNPSCRKKITKIMFFVEKYSRNEFTKA